MVDITRFPLWVGCIDCKGIRFGTSHCIRFIWWFPQMGDHQNGWLMENPISIFQESCIWTTMICPRHELPSDSLSHLSKPTQFWPLVFHSLVFHMNQTNRGPSDYVNQQFSVAHFVDLPMAPSSMTPLFVRPKHHQRCLAHGLVAHKDHLAPSR